MIYQYCREPTKHSPCNPCHRQLKNEETKLCPYCEENIPLRGYYKHRNTTNGLQAYCKACKQKVDRRYKPCKIEALYKESVYHLIQCEFPWRWNVDLLGLSKTQQQKIATMVQQREGFDPSKISYIEYLQMKE